MLLAAVSGPASAQKVYRWVDQDGNVHYGDRVPPEYAAQVFGAPEAEPGTGPKDEAAQRQAQEDRVLLMTYLTVAEIEAVRDRRIDQLQSRAAVTQRYLENLHERLDKLEREEKWYGRVNPETGESGKVPEEVTADLATTRASIADYEGRMAKSAAEQQAIEDKFAKDIHRFRELKGLPAEDEVTAGDAGEGQDEPTTAEAKSGGE
jgi:hypothetical protein